MAKNTNEVIIDGVDVSVCDYAILPKNQCPNKPMPYAKETSCIACKAHNTRLNFCKNNPDCYFKQLQRLKKENEEKDKKLKYIRNVLTNPYNYGSFTKLIPEYLLKTAFNDSIENVFKDDYQAKRDAQTIEKVVKYEECLEEIKAVCNAIIDGYHFTDDIEGYLKELVKIGFLDKINEVLDANIQSQKRMV